MLFFSLHLALANPPPIINGEEAGELHPEVAGLVASEGSDLNLFCSATLIHPRFLITAGHCIDAVEQYAEQGKSLSGLFGPARAAPTETVAMLNWWKHPEYEPGTLNHDLGLIELAEAVELTPVPLSLLPPEEAWLDLPMRYVGWGVTSDGGSDADTKRFADMPYYFYDEQFHYGIDFSGTVNLCTGDSGGSLFQYGGADGSELLLVGVNSFVFSLTEEGPPCEGGGAGSVRLDAHQEWIRSTVPELDIWEERPPSVEEEEEVLADTASPEPEPAQEPSSSEPSAEKGRLGCSFITSASGGGLVLSFLVVGRIRRESG